MWSPFVMLPVLAGLVSVPKYLYEAAAIDRVFFGRSTFPYIRGLMLLALLFWTIESFLGAPRERRPMIPF
jgi:multiple sugar transport system permease protein